jgi:hypothetical protein
MSYGDAANVEEAFAKGQPAPGLGPDTAAEYKAVQATVGLPGLIDIEQRTMGG